VGVQGKAKRRGFAWTFVEQKRQTNPWAEEKKRQNRGGSELVLKNVVGTLLFSKKNTKKKKHWNQKGDGCRGGGL